jgi:hypothetical protein
MTKETEKNKFALPPVWCGSICRNAMSEVCIEHCAVKRDCSGFALKPGMNLIVSARYPIEDISKMTKEERFTSLAAYVAMTVDHLKGVHDEPEYRPIPRRNPNRSNGSSVPETLQSQGVLSDPAKPDTLHQDRKECENQEVRSVEVD